MASNCLFQGLYFLSISLQTSTFFIAFVKPVLHQWSSVQSPDLLAKPFQLKRD